MSMSQYRSEVVVALFSVGKHVIFHELRPNLDAAISSSESQVRGKLKAMILMCILPHSTRTPVLSETRAKFEWEGNQHV